jgi:hypothetical protein
MKIAIRWRLTCRAVLERGRGVRFLRVNTLAVTSAIVSEDIRSMNFAFLVLQSRLFG